jgi:NAD(P)-dependent dehydrogenase (short-subunit alcohol dehydrogenase family)
MKIGLTGDIMKTVFVSGGTSRIGEALVRHFTGAGHRVFFQFKGKDVEAAQLERESGAHAIQIDFLSAWKPPDIEVDVLVHNAGVNLSGEPFDRTSDQELADSVEVNIVAVLRLTKQFAKRMRKSGWGRIININSIYGFRAGKRRLSYNVSKFGLRAVTQSLAIELAEAGITVNEICPGPIETDMLLKMGELAVREGRAADITRYLVDVASAVPIQRLI